MNENDMRFSSPVEEKKEEKKTKLPKKLLKKIGIILILIIAILTLFLAKDLIFGIFKGKPDIYSAVFLANGQVYFGKMIANNQSEIVLNNVFYIQINDKAAAAGGATALGQTSFNLVKLGNELHGPTDELFVNKLQVVFYEKLRADSKVVESIKNYKN